MGKRPKKARSSTQIERWIYLGSEYDRWQILKMKIGASTDIELLTMLVDSYIKLHMKDSEQLQGTIHFPVTSNHVKTSTGDTEKAQETDTDEPTEIKMECDSDTESPTDITTDVNFDTSVQVDDNEKDTDKDNGVNIDNLPGTKSGSEASTTVSHVVATIGSDDINTDIEAGASVGALDSNIESKEDRVNTNRQKRDLWTGAFVDFTQKSRKTSTETVKKSKDKVGACSTNSEKTKSQQNESKRKELPTTVMIGGEMITIKVEKEDEDQYEQKEEPEDSESPSGDATPRQNNMSEKSQFAENSSNYIIGEYQVSKNTIKSNHLASELLRQYLKEKDLPQDYEDLDEDQLDEILSRFYMDVRTKGGELYKAKTLQHIRYALNRYLKSPPHRKKYDIITDKAFKKSNEIFKIALQEIRRAGKGSVQHFEKIKQSDFRKLYTSSFLDPSTAKGLLNRVQLNIRLFFSRHATDNMTNMHKDSFVIAEYEDGTKYVVKKDTLTKHQYIDNVKLTSGHMPEDKSNPEFCPVATYLKYISKLNPACDRLWQYPRDNFEVTDDVWYQNRPVGRDTMATFIHSLSKQVGLSQKYTNHCIRVTVTSLLSKGDFSSTHIMSIAGSKSINSISSNQKATDQEKRAMAMAIYEYVQPKPAQMHPVTVPSQIGALPSSNSVTSLPLPVNLGQLQTVVILQYPQHPQQPTT